MTDENPEQYPDQNMDEIFSQNKELQNKNLDLSSALSSRSFNEQDEQNLILYQLETDKILERIEHFLKGDQVKFGEQGAYFSEPTKSILTVLKKDPKTNLLYYIQELKEMKKGTEKINEVVVKISKDKGKDTDEESIDIQEVDSKKILEKLKKVKLKNLGYKYVTTLDESKKPLNEYGVAELMRIMSMYITKETFLSYYSEERINEILGDLGDALNNFLYCNYEKMGMDTKFKESKYILICLNLLHTVESCYRRAIDGAEQENLRTRAIVTQNQGFGGRGMSPQRNSQMGKKWNPFKPSTW